MERRALGHDGTTVGAIGYGAMGLSGVYGPSSDNGGIATIHRALEPGIDLIDTADTYGDGHNERLVGRAIAGRREQVVLSTKFGGGPTEPGAGLGRPQRVRGWLEASLRRLGIVRVAEPRGAPAPPQLALAWLLRHDQVIPLVGTRFLAHLESNLRAARVGLAPADLQAIDAAAPRGAAAGARYPSEFAAALNA